MSLNRNRITAPVYNKDRLRNFNVYTSVSVSALRRRHWPLVFIEGHKVVDREVPRTIEMFTEP